MPHRWTVLGVPSSAAAHWPGLDRGPGAWREAGIVDALGADDAGNRPVAVWRADRPDDRPNAWRDVVRVVDDARAALVPLLQTGGRVLVLGGECTVAVALVAAAVERFDDVGLVYVDGGQDLMIPVDHLEEPILDAMGVAHLLDLPGCVPELAGVGGRRPLLRPEDVVLVGYWGEEEDVHGLVPSVRLPASRLLEDPEGAARAALAALRNERVVVHLDTDVLDALRSPMADIASYGHGVGLEHLEPLLRTLLADERVVGMTLVEANPDHDPGLASFRAAVEMLARASSVL